MTQATVVNVALAVAIGVLAGLVLRRLLGRGQPAEPVIDHLTYRDVVEYFVHHRPADQQVKKAGLLRQQIGRQFHVHWCYLDDEMNLCFDADDTQLGRSAWVRSFDDELQRMFGEHDLVIFE